MKSRNQTGSAHVVIIIILVIALVGALGFVFWQNFMNKPAVSNGSTTSTQTTTKNSNLTIVTEWGVKGDISILDGATYEIATENTQTSGDYQSLKFSTSDLIADCKNNRGSIVRLSGDQELPNVTVTSEATAAETYAKSSDNAAHIGQYYYFYFGAFGAGVCSNDTADNAVVTSINTATKSFLNSLIAQ